MELYLRFIRRLRGVLVHSDEGCSGIQLCVPVAHTVPADAFPPCTPCHTTVRSVQHHRLLQLNMTALEEVWRP